MHPALPQGPHGRPVSTGDGDGDNHGDGDMVQGEAQAPPSAPGCGTCPRRGRGPAVCHPGVPGRSAPWQATQPVLFLYLVIVQLHRRTPAPDACVTWGQALSLLPQAPETALLHSGVASAPAGVSNLPAQPGSSLWRPWALKSQRQPRPPPAHHSASGPGPDPLGAGTRHMSTVGGEGLPATLALPGARNNGTTVPEPDVGGGVAGPRH